MIKEPTLINEKKKCVEMRSWKTAYRGELFIHASSSKTKNFDRVELLNLLEEAPHYGKIICKCKLVDCIRMTEEYVS